MTDIAFPHPRAFAGTAPGIILKAGFAAGMLDVVYFSSLAFIDGSTPAQTLRGIASFWLGPNAPHIQGAALLGLVTHFTLSCIMAAGFAVLGKAAPGVPKRPTISGPLYGLFLYAVMYGVVLPTRWPTVYPRYDGARSVADVALHLAFGFLIAIIISRRPQTTVEAPSQ